MYQLEIVTAQRDTLVSTLENLLNEPTAKNLGAASATLNRIKSDILSGSIPKETPAILTDELSREKLWEIMPNEELWDLPENRLKGYHEEGKKYVAWDNSTGHCNVENFRKESQALAWLNDEEI